jgi:serine/threonine protein kinase
MNNQDKFIPFDTTPTKCTSIIETIKQDSTSCASITQAIQEGNIPEGLTGTIQLMPQYTQTGFDISQYKFGNFIRSGAYNEVWTLVTKEGKETDYVIRYIKPNINMANNSMRSVLEQTKIAYQLQSIISEKIQQDKENNIDKQYQAGTYLPTIYQYGTYDKNDHWSSAHMYCIMNKIKGDELFTWLSKNILYPVETALEIFISIIKGLKILHCLKIIHNDLKTENIMSSNPSKDNIHTTIIDYDMSVIDSRLTDDQNIKYNVFQGTPEYLSPEKILNQGYNYKGDVWSCGVILHELLTGSLPYNHSGDRRQLYNNIKDMDTNNIYTNVRLNPRFVKINKQINFNTKRKIQQILMGCLTKNQETRFSYDQILTILDKEWLDKYNKQCPNSLADLRKYIKTKYNNKDFIEKYVCQINELYNQKIQRAKNDTGTILNTITNEKYKCSSKNNVTNSSGTNSPPTNSSNKSSVEPQTPPGSFVKTNSSNKSSVEPQTPPGSFVKTNSAYAQPDQLISKLMQLQSQNNFKNQSISQKRPASLIESEPKRINSKSSSFRTVSGPANLNTSGGGSSKKSKKPSKNKLIKRKNKSKSRQTKKSNKKQKGGTKKLSRRKHYRKKTTSSK